MHLPVRILGFLVVLFATFVAAPSPTHAQPDGATSGGSFYNYAGNADLAINVNIWGFVRNPGRYRVAASMKLGELISLAGGPTDRARLSDIRIIHDLTVDSTIIEPVVIYNLDEYQRTADTNLNPILIDNDTVVVPGDALNVFREILGIISDVALIIGTLIALWLTLGGGGNNN